MDENTGWVEEMDKTDLETVTYNRIQIAKGCVKCYARQSAVGVKVEMYLPSQVQTVIIAQYGSDIPMCYAENMGKNVYSGDKLKKDPFK